MLEFFVGLFIGGFLGVAAMCLCNIAAASDRDMKKLMRNSDSHKHDNEKKNN